MRQAAHLWTLEELVKRVQAALDEEGLEQASGRVRQAPDGRTIRYYTTLGLIDRPAGVRHRRRLYDERHLQQVLAIKRLQADGASLAEVQQRLLGADAGVLAELSGRPPLPESQGEGRSERRDFWRLEPTTPSRDLSDRGAPVTGLTVGGGVTVVIAGAARELTEAEREALAAASEPLLAELERLGLIRGGRG